MKTNFNNDLTFLLINHYQEVKGAIQNFTTQPRPYHSLALMLEGEALFHTSNQKIIEFHSGDILFVPWNCKYYSEWVATKSSFITIHFNFAPNHPFFQQKNFPLQKITLSNSPKDTFLFLQKHQYDTDQTFFLVMSRFYTLCQEVFSITTYTNTKKITKEILTSIQYLEKHYKENFPVELLAQKANLSESHFYARFKMETGLTPIEYKNILRIKNAMQLLFDGSAVEEVASQSGFLTTEYFRKLFRQTTGYNPSKIKHKQKKTV